jgi:hypothetical protein
MGRILIWTEESDFFTYYKRLGPFAILATSSVYTRDSEGKDLTQIGQEPLSGTLKIIWHPRLVERWAARTGTLMSYFIKETHIPPDFVVTSGVFHNYLDISMCYLHCVL